MRVRRHSRENYTVRQRDLYLRDTPIAILLSLATSDLHKHCVCIPLVKLNQQVVAVEFDLPF